MNQILIFVIEVLAFCLNLLSYIIKKQQTKNKKQK
jgi:hypothetical protein